MSDIDTIVLKYHVSLDEDALRLDFDRHTRDNSKTGERTIWYRHAIEVGAAMLNLCYRPVDYNGQPSLLVEVTSLPKLVRGNNHSPDSSIPQAMDTLTEVFAQIPWLAQLNVGEGELVRVDFCHNFQVGEHLPDYLTAIAKLQYARRRRSIFTNGEKNQ